MAPFNNYGQGKGTCSLSPNLTPPSIISNQNPKTQRHQQRQFTSHPRPASKPSNIVKSTLLPIPLQTNHLLPHGRTPFSTLLTPRLDMGTVVDGHGNLRNVGSWKDGGELPDYIDEEDKRAEGGWFYDPPLSKEKKDNRGVSKVKIEVVKGNVRGNGKVKLKAKVERNSITKPKSRQKITRNSAPQAPKSINKTKLKLSPKTTNKKSFKSSLITTIRLIQTARTSPSPQTKTHSTFSTPDQPKPNQLNTLEIISLPQQPNRQ